MQACGATREPLRDAGWECDGTNLVVLSDTAGPIRAGETVTVIRADLLEGLGDEYQGFTAEPFTGGDHLHLTIDRNEPVAAA